MDSRVNQVAARANLAAYNPEGTAHYVDGAPHLKHGSLRTLYGQLIVEIYDRAVRQTAQPRVLDLGAGEGTVTWPLLELGAHVTAVDISASQLDALRGRCRQFADRLDVVCADVTQAIAALDARFDLVIVNSFLHHVPDYLGLIRSASGLLRPRGQFFSFQDPMRYDSLGMATRSFSYAAYYSWRVRRGDLTGGLSRYIRRRRGVYLEESMHDNAEYHVVRNGCDQSAIAALLEQLGFDCTLVRYFSTQDGLFQRLGASLGLKNMFAVIAQKR